MNTLRLLLILSIILIAITLVQIHRVDSGQTKDSKIQHRSKSPVFSQDVLSKRENTINIYIYPNAKQKSSSNNVLILESTDEPRQITEWYKKQITKNGMKTKTFIQTKTNDNVLNKLVGTNNTQSITVKITQKNNSSTTKIEITAITS